MGIRAELTRCPDGKRAMITFSGGGISSSILVDDIKLAAAIAGLVNNAVRREVSASVEAGLRGTNYVEPAPDPGGRVDAEDGGARRLVATIPPRPCAFRSAIKLAFAIEDRVTIDGDGSLHGTVTALIQRAGGAQYEVAWIHGGQPYADTFDAFRLALAEGQA